MIDNKQNTIPKNWKKKSLSDVIFEMKDGGTPSKSNKKYFDGKIPWVNIKDIVPEIYKTKNTISEEGLKKSSAKLWPEESVILSFGATIGEVGIAKTKLTTKQGIAGIIPNKNVISKFLYYYLILQKKKLNQLATGSTIKEVRPNIIRKHLSILLPPINEQKKIAEILSTVDREIEKTDEIIQKTEKLKQGLMQKIFEKEKNNRLKINDCASYVGSGVTPSGGSKVYQKEGIPLIRSQNVHFHGLVYKDIAYITEDIHKKMIRTKTISNDVLLNITGASLGRVCYVPEKFPESNVNQHVCIIRTNNNLYYKYLFYFLQSPFGQKQIFAFQAGGNREGLNFQQIRSIRLPVPEIAVQKQIAEILSSIDKKIDIYKKIKNNLTQLKKGLMQDLLSGKVRI